jgi:hypothetical protein
MTITRKGAVVDGRLISGPVVIEADNVRIRRSLIRTSARYAIRVMPGFGGLVVEDTEIDGLGQSGPAVASGGYTLRRVDIHDVTEGPRVGTGSVIESSYIHDLVRCSGCHIDALQSTGGSNIVIRGNNLQAYNAATDDPMNAAYQFGEEFAPLRNVLVEGNLLNGGNYTVNGGGGGTTDAQVVFRDNVFQRNFRYGAISSLGPGVDFDESNVWADTGAPVSAGNP